MRNHFRPARFDVVTGVSILHHLIDPSAAIKAAFKALKPDGVAVFFDPFEGYGMLDLAFNLILDRATREHRPLGGEAAEFMRAMIRDFNARRGRFLHMDDKWLFTRDYFERAADEAGFASMSILPHGNHASYFKDTAEVLFRLSRFNLPHSALPGWK